MTGKEICDTVRKAHPLDHDFQSDARYVWPARWEELPTAIDAAIAEAVAREREACAVLCETTKDCENDTDYHHVSEGHCRLADAIRARSTP